MIITPTFTPSFDTNFGANAAAARAAWAAAAEIFTGRLSDDIHINITVDALPGTNVFGESFARLLSISYADLFNRISANATTQDDLVAVGPGGSMTAADPTNGAGTWWLTRAQAKALGVIPDDMSDDGGTTFGAGNPFTFAGQIAAGTFDFRGLAAHEISEVMGRLGLSGGTVDSTANSFSLVDNFSYTGPGTKGLRGGPGNNFSIDNGTTLLKLWNDPISNGLDSRDWAGGTNDAFNQFSSGGVVNPVSAVDLQLMDVIGYAPVWQHLSPIPGHPLQADFDCSGLPNAGRSVSVGDVDGDGRAEVIVQIDAAQLGRQRLLGDEVRPRRGKLVAPVTDPRASAAGGFRLLGPAERRSIGQRRRRRWRRTRRGHRADRRGELGRQRLLGDEIRPRRERRWQHLSQIPGHPLQADFDCSGLPNGGRSVSVGDVDGDGRAEVIVQIDAAHSGGNDFWVMKFDPAAGIWQHLSQIPGHPLQADFDCSGLPNAGRSVSVGDVDGDGRAEVIVQIDAAHSGGNDFWVMKFDPAAGIWQHLSPIPGHPLQADFDCSGLPNAGRSVSVGDVDGDGRAEVIVQIDAAHSGGNDFWVMKFDPAAGSLAALVTDPRASTAGGFRLLRPAERRSLGQRRRRRWRRPRRGHRSDRCIGFGWE